jgi:AcrR family transcriptional regulator
MFFIYKEATMKIKVEKDNAPPESRMERKKKDVREKIIAAAVELFAHNGYANTTMEQIAEAADVARKTLYNYFPVKEAIADAHARNVSLLMAEKNLVMIQGLPDTRSRLVAALNNVYTWVEANPELAAIAIGYRLKNFCAESEEHPELTGTQRVMDEIIRRGQEAGEIRSDISIKMVVIYLDALRGSTFFEWLKDRSKFKLRMEIVKIVDMILFGIGTGDHKSGNKKSIKK